ncbi:methionine synthase [Spirochaetia bacterium]|nr:methionine synthase [Spirochaetia bacterium]
MNTTETLNALAAERILILDGAMGSMIQSYRLTEADFRGSRFAAHPTPLSGCNDLLCLTKPQVIASIHTAYLEAGADIIETCSLNASAISLADFGLETLSYELSHTAAALARTCTAACSTADKPRFVAGSIGPTVKSASLPTDTNDLSKRAIEWDALEAAYYDNVRGLLDGGADILLLETFYDALNAKAAIAAILRLFEERGLTQTDVPIMISATVADDFGRILTGQTIEAFCVAVAHAKPWSLGLNCSFGAQRLKPALKRLADVAPCFVSAYPNGGMPNQMGDYDQSPQEMAQYIEEYLQEGLVTIIGGCCGTTPEHIKLIAEKAAKYPPRPVPPPKHGSYLAGLEPLRIEPAPGGLGFMPIGERCNVAGNKKFLKLISAHNYEAGIGIIEEELARGAALLDICMDDALLDSVKEIKAFVSLALSNPAIARTPFVIDSSRWDVIEAALKLIGGKAVINSMSLKEGEAVFMERSRLARRYGASIIFMLFDERGQAASFERKIEIAARAYKLLTEDGFPPENIVFDPNVLTIATGMPEHDDYAVNFIRAVAWIKEHCPGAIVMGGIANLSFSFKGNDYIREAMHAVFVKHAVEAGMTLANVNLSTMLTVEELDPDVREAAEDVVLNRNQPASLERLLALATAVKSTAVGRTAMSAESWRTLSGEERIVQAVIHGSDEYLEHDLLEIQPRYTHAITIVEAVLMKGMQEVSAGLSSGRMFLPQVIRSAKVMKSAIAVLKPFIEAQKQLDGAVGGETAILLATVKGDVHDIGKNFVGVILGCNGFKVIDLGVMVSTETIVETALREKVSIIGLSGLISPSLEEMIKTAQELEQRGLRIPLLIGGAAASLAYTSIHIAPVYSGAVVYMKDASLVPDSVRALLSDSERPRFLEKLDRSYAEAAANHLDIVSKQRLKSLAQARFNRLPPVAPAPEPKQHIIEIQDYPIASLVQHIDWDSFLRSWDMGTSAKAEAQPAQELLAAAQTLLNKLIAKELPEVKLQLKALVGFFPAYSDNEDIVVQSGTALQNEERFCFLRNQEEKRAGAPNSCLADFIAPAKHGIAQDWLGVFALSAGIGLNEAVAHLNSRNDIYTALLLQSLANSLAEAFSAELHERVRREWWGYTEYPGIRPAFGYPMCPDHHDKERVFSLLQAQRIGLTLTESAMIIPAASSCGMYIAQPSAYYFGVGAVAEDQLDDWARRKHISTDEARIRTARI